MATPTTSGTVSTFIQSGINDLDAILNGDGMRWGTGSGTTTITYSFPGSDATWMSKYGPEVTAANFAPIPLAQQAAIREALATWSAVANIVFQEISETATSVGDIRIAYSYAVGNEAWGYSSYPDSDSSYADIWINRATVLDAGATYTPGDIDFENVIHESGHSLGLKHPGNYNAGGGGAEPPYITPSLDMSNFTIMSYTEPEWTDAHGQTISPQTPGVYDIRAIQYLYGVNTTTYAGNTTYTYTPDNLVGLSIWDAGGSDTIDASAFATAVQIDLQDGHYSDIGLTDNIGIAFDAVIENAIGGSDGDILIGNDVANILTGGVGDDRFVFTVAPSSSADIDSLTDFVSGSDKIYLSSAAFSSLTAGADLTTVFAAGPGMTAADVSERLIYNTTTGALYYDADGSGASAAVQFAQLSGAPTLAATDIEVYGAGGDDSGAGSDVILYDGKFEYGDDGPDYFIGSSDNDELYGWGGDDSLDGDAGDDYLDGYDGIDDIAGGSGDDVVWAGTGNDSVAGDDGDDTIFGESGNDTVLAGAGVDYVDGSAGNDSIDGGDGDDLLYGYLGNDILRGGTGNDEISGEDGKDQLYGNDGDDLIYGGGSADRMTGGAGDDIYYVDTKKDVVTETADGGSDSVVSTISYMLGANVEDLYLYSLSSALSGTGNTLNNYMVGDYENDTLNGKEGNDTLEGGEGSDIFVFSTALSSSSNTDTINDFISGEDFIRLSKKVFSGISTGAVKANNLVSFDSSETSTAASNGGGEHFLYDTATGDLYFDKDGSGSGTAVKFAILAGLPELSASDLIIF